MNGKSYQLKDAVRKETPQEKPCKAEKEKSDATHTRSWDCRVESWRDG